MQCCGQEKWGDWKPHLAVMLANETADPGVQRKAVVAMGDTLGNGCRDVKMGIMMILLLLVLLLLKNQDR